jgi:hypothetical protein
MNDRFERVQNQAVVIYLRIILLASRNTMEAERLVIGARLGRRSAEARAKDVTLHRSWSDSQHQDINWAQWQKPNCEHDVCSTYVEAYQKYALGMNLTAHQTAASYTEDEPASHWIQDVLLLLQIKSKVIFCLNWK